MNISKVALAVLLLIGIASADTFGNWTVTNWESTIGGGLGTIFGSGSYCFGVTNTATDPPTCEGVSLDFGSIMMSVMLIGFIFIWSSVSGIAWDGVFFLLMIILVMMAMPAGGLLGMTAWGVYIFLWSIIIMAIFYRTILRRG